MYYTFPSHFCLNTCSAGDNYAHARTVDTRLFLSSPTKSLGMRLLYLLDGKPIRARTQHVTALSTSLHSVRTSLHSVRHCTQYVIALSTSLHSVRHFYASKQKPYAKGSQIRGLYNCGLERYCKLLYPGKGAYKQD